VDVVLVDSLVSLLLVHGRKETELVEEELVVVVVGFVLNEP
jgi:hypothetical protein